MRRYKLRGSLALFALTLLAASCADDKPLNTFEPRGEKAQTIYDSMIHIWWIVLVVFILVVGGTIALTIKGRVKPEDYDENDLPAQIHGHTKAELGWTIAPAILLAAISVPMVNTIWELEEDNAPGELDVMVIGNQWWWEYRYDIDGDGFFEDADGDGELYGPDGTGDQDDKEWPLNIALDDDDLSVPNQMVIPVGQQVDLTLTSRDVVHSFWIPRLNGKRDTVPGRLTYWSVQADETGEYNGWCTEFCGLSHARMRMSVVVLSEAEFDQWLADQTAPSEVPAEGTAERAGYDVFVSQCSRCHVVSNDDQELQDAYPKDFEADLLNGAAPDLTHFASRSVFAGATYSQYFGIDPDDDNLDASQYLELSDIGIFNEAEVRAWIKDAPSRKEMFDEGRRGMPSFETLSDPDLDNLVAYLATLD